MSTTNPVHFFEDVGHRIGLALAARVLIHAPPAVQTVKRAARAATRAPARAVRPAKRVAAVPLRAAKRVRDGATVWYRQGRGAFEATVLRAKHPTGLVLLQRAADLKRVLRPADRIYVSR